MTARTIRDRIAGCFPFGSARDAELVRFVHQHTRIRTDRKAMEHHYVVMATVSTGWLVERDARGIALHDALQEAIAEAVEAARDEASEDDVVCRVTLVDERGDRLPLTRFGQLVGGGMLLKRIRKWNDPADAARARISAKLEA